MLYSPTILDGSVPVLPTITGALSTYEPAIAEDYGFGLPCISATVSTVSVSCVDGIALAVPTVAGLASHAAPSLISDYSSIPIAATGVTIATQRVPNPYSPEEMRKAIQNVHNAEGAQTTITATINTKLSIVQSNVTELESRITAIEDTASEYSAESDSSVVIGQPLYVKSNTHIALARANDTATTRVLGFAITAAEPTFIVRYETEGKLTLADWTAITGEALLTPGATYFLDYSTAGKITSAAPSTGYVVCVGRAISTITLDIEIQQPIKL